MKDHFDKMLIQELIADDRNANRGTSRGRAAVKSSLETLGAGRSILIDRDGRVVAGNKTLEAARLVGIKDVVTVETDGTKLVAVKRMDLSLDDPKGRELAIADNRSAELGLEWEPAVLKDLSADLDLKPFFTDGELKKVTGPEPPAEQDLGSIGEDLTYKIVITCTDEMQQTELLDGFAKEGINCQALTL